MFTIIISEKGGAERRQLFEQDEVSIGRVQGNDLVLPKGNVSKRHCRLERVEGRFTVTDQNSTNGTYLNRRRISQSTVVRQGDRIYVGDFVLRIEEGAIEGAVPGPAAMPVSHGPNTPAVAVQTPQRAEQSPLPTPSSEGPPKRASIPARTTMVHSPAEERMSDVGSTRTSKADASEVSVAVDVIRFVVERVSAQMSPAELSSPSSAHRVDALIEAVLKELQSDGVPSGRSDATEIAECARAELLAQGPLGPLLEDPSVAEIAVAGPGPIAVVRGSRERELVAPFSSSVSLERAVERLCAREGVPLKPTERVARRQLSSSGFELEIVRGEIAPQGPVVHLRRQYPATTTFEDLVRMGTVSRSVATFLEQCAKGRANVLVVGPRRSGATEVLSALAGASGEHVLSLTEDEDIAAAGATFVSNLRAVRGLDTQALLSSLAKLPGHRLLVDGLLDPDRAKAMLRIAAEGAEGIIGRLTARNIERGLAQICAQLAIGNPGTAAATFAEGLIATFDLVLEVARLPDGRSRVVRVSELGRGETSPIVAYDVFCFTVERIATGGAVEGSFTPTGRQPQFAGEMRLRGGRVDSGMFGRAARPPYPG